MSAPADAAPWSRVAERGSLLGLRITVACYRLFGRALALALVHGVVAYFFATDRAGRRASRAYLRRVHATAEGRARLGERSPGAWTSFLHYRSFALAIVDRLELWFGREEAFRFETHGCDYFDRLAAEGRGAIVLGAHLGSFDALRLLARRKRMTVNVLMYTRNAARINAIFRELDPETDERVIPVSPDSVSAVFRARECVARGELVAILCDRVEPRDRGRTSRVPLLGDDVELPESPALLAALLGCPVVLTLALRRGPRDYAVFAEELASRLPRRGREAAAAQLLARYAARLEHHLLREPLQWFNFFDYWGDAAGAAERPGGGA